MCRTLSSKRNVALCKQQAITYSNHFGFDSNTFDFYAQNNSTHYLFSAGNRSAAENRKISKPHAKFNEIESDERCSHMFCWAATPNGMHNKKPSRFFVCKQWTVQTFNTTFDIVKKNYCRLWLTSSRPTAPVRCDPKWENTYVNVIDIAIVFVWCCCLIGAYYGNCRCQLWPSISLHGYVCVNVNILL